MVRRDKGFSLLEVLISLVIFSLFAVGIAQTFAFQLKTNSNSEMRSNAIQAAQYVLDKIRTQDISALPTSGSDPAQNITINNRPYSVVISYCVVSSYCTTTTTRQIRASVSHLGKKRYEVDTVFAQLR